MAKTGESLARYGSVAAVAGGSLWSAGVVFGETGLGVFADSWLFLAPLLQAGGLAAFYALYSGSMQRLGEAGLVQGLVGLLLLAGGLFADLALGVEEAQRVVSFGFLISALGLVLLGFESLKREPLPRLNFLPLALGLLTPLGTILGVEPAVSIAISVLFGFGWIALGVVMLLDRREERPG